MSDRHRIRRPVEAVTASARVLAPTHHDAPTPEHWHIEAWAMRDTVGELRFAETWLSNALSRSRLFAAKRPEPGQEPEPVETGPAFDLVEKLAGGVGGQADLLRQFGSYLMIPGVGYLVGEAREHGESFRVVNAEDIKLGKTPQGNQGYELREGEQAGDWRVLPENSVVTKVYRPHPRHRWEPDSPVRAALPILRELLLLTQHVEATATSRLAGAGMQFFPTEMELPGGWEQFISDWVAAQVQPIRDRAATSAKVPFPMRVPGEFLQWMQNAFVTYSTPFDQQSMALREEAITRLANAMDMPRQIITGEQQNHWGSWQVEESGLKGHIEPTLEVICDGLTVGYLTPGLSAATEIDEAARQAMDEVLADTPMADVIIWYDTSDLRVRPDRGPSAQEAYDRYQVNGEALRKELGLSEAEPWDPDDEDTQRVILLTHATSPQSPLAETALKKLGILDDDDLPAPAPAMPEPGSTGVPPPEPEPATPPGPPAEGERSLPPPPTAPPEQAPRQLPTRAADVVPDDVAGLSPGLALVAACYTLVDRALEVAGKRVLSRMPQPERPPQERCPASKLHTCLDTPPVMPVAMQFIGAWDRLPDVADRLGEDHGALRAALDAYTKGLVATRTEHTWDRLATALGVCPCETETP